MTETTATIANEAAARVAAARETWEAATAAIAPCPLLGTDAEVAEWMTATADARQAQADALAAAHAAADEWTVARGAALAADVTYLPKF